MKKLVLILSLSLIGCVKSVNGETVSLLDYTTPSELSELGYTPDKVDETNETMEAYFGYNRYEGYLKHKINNFEILSNPNNPDEIYIVKDGDFIAGMRESNSIMLYKEGTKFPNPANTFIYFDRAKPLAVIADNKQMYFDANLDGVDAVYEKYWHKGIDQYLNYVDLFGALPRYEILTEANIPNQQCEKVAGPFACCLKEDQTYQPYHFTYERGWEISSDNEIAQKKCNARE